MTEKMDTDNGKAAGKATAAGNANMLGAIAEITEHGNLVQSILNDFEMTRTKKKKVKEIEQQEEAGQPASGPPKTYAMQTVPDLRVMVYASRHTKQPLQMAHYQHLSQLIVEKCAAGLIAKFTRGAEDAPVVNCAVHGLDQETKGLPITPTSTYSYDWLMKEIEAITLDGVKFRAWGLGEEPETFAFQLYLNENYNSLTVQQIQLLLLNLNDEIAMTDFKIEDSIDQKDRRDNDKGRVFSVIGDNDFREYCVARNYQLAFASGPISCTTEAERLKRLQAKHRSAAAAKAPTATTSGTDNSNKGGSYGRPGGNVPYKIPKKK
jgi:hypothetical protein